MCWSKRSPAKDEDSIPTTTRKPMGELRKYLNKDIRMTD